MLNDVPTCENQELLGKTLREGIGFADGVVVSDCGAVRNACAGNWTTPGRPRNAPSNPPPPPPPPGVMNFTTTELCEAAAGASAVIAGTDMNCGGLYKTALPNAVALGFDPAFP